MMQIPTPQGQLSQPNKGELSGNLFATYNIDLLTNKGFIRSAGSTKKALDQNDDTDFDGYVSFIGYTNGTVVAASNEVFTTPSLTNPTGTWTEQPGTQVSTDLRDGDYFLGQLVVTDGDDIRAWNQTTRTSYWQGTLGQSALSTSKRNLIKTGADGNLYVTDAGNKLYKVDKDGSTVTKTGAGSLDFSDTDFEFTCMETTSTRLWIGTFHQQEGEAVIIEWDMSPSSISANKLHPIGANAVRCIGIWNDTPIAILSSGRIKYHNGSQFVDWPGGDLQTYIDNLKMEDDFVHPNGWSIIDGLPHFLIKGATKRSGTYDQNTKTPFYIPSGVYCLDPEVGLYHRFAVGSGKSTQSDYGQISLSKVGALWAPETYGLKFYASYEYYVDQTTTKSVLSYYEPSDSQPHRSWFVTQPLPLKEVPKQVQAYFKRLSSGDSLNFSYRTHTHTPIVLDGGWEDTNKFNSTDDYGDAEPGDLLLVKNGNGAGFMSHIEKIADNGTTFEFTLKDDNPFVTASDTATVEILKFKKIGSVTTTGKDWETINIPTDVKARKVQLLVELVAAGSEKIEVDSVIIE